MGSYEVAFTTLTYGGDALGRLPDGRAVFAPFILPGEVAEIELVEEKKRHARARLVRILEPSPKRIQPRCAHFGECGGCHYQHLAYQDQLLIKQAIVKEQFARVGGMPDAPVEAVIPCDNPWNYRNSLQLHLDPQGRPGFHRSGSHTVMPVEECWLPEAGLDDLRRALAFDAQMNIERVKLRCGSHDDLMVILEGAPDQLPAFESDMPVSVVHRAGDHQVVLAGQDALTIMVKDREFRVSADSFFQVNIGQAQKMVDWVCSTLPVTNADILIDVYCGVGLFSAFLAGRAGHVVGVEMSEPACEDFIFNLDAFENVSLYQGAAESVLPGLDLRPTAVIVDPPRTGIELPAMDALIRCGARHLVYVSCDPATLARDARRLTAGGYQLNRIQPIDMFPQTYHIECMGVFERK
jgi:23S rRNA (uracil1939-C5)-methyltransferase